MSANWSFGHAVSGSAHTKVTATRDTTFSSDSAFAQCKQPEAFERLEKRLEESGRKLPSFSATSANMSCYPGLFMTVDGAAQTGPVVGLWSLMAS